MNNFSNNFTFENVPDVLGRPMPFHSNRSNCVIAENEFIRFEEKKERYIWALPDEICFVKSADHYIKALIQCGTERRWMTRHCTIKNLLHLLPDNNFIRLNRFYLLNRKHFLCINEKEKFLCLTGEFSIPIPHRISPYLRHLLKTTCT